MFFTSGGAPRLNFHKIRKTLDSDCKCSPVSHFEFVFCAKATSGKNIDYTIADNIVIVTESGYSEGDEVDIWLWCLRASEGGGICEQEIVQADEDTYQDYLDML